MKVAAAALLTVLLAALANVLVDPMGLFFLVRAPGFNAYKPEVLNYWHLALPLRARLVRPEVVVLGSSRVLAGMPVDAIRPGAVTANLGLPGATLCDMADAFEIAAAGGRLTLAVVGLDFFAANAARIPADCGLREARAHPWRLLLATTVSSDTLNASLKTVTKQRRVDAAIWQPAPDGTARLDPGYTARRGGMRKMFAEIEDIYARDYYLVRPQCRFELHPADPARAGLAHLRRLLREAHARGIELRLFFSPEHVRLFGLADAAGIGDLHAEWVREVAAANRDEAARAARPAFTLLYPVEAAWITETVPPAGDLTEPRHFIDGSHYTPATGRAILARLAAAPAQAPESAHRLAVETARAYLNTHAADRAEVAAAAARARATCGNRS